MPEQEIIMPQIKIDKVDVLFKGGIYTAFIDIMRDQPISIPSEEFRPSDDIFPRSFNDIREVYSYFPGAKVNIIGKEIINDRVASDVSEDEIAAIMKSNVEWDKKQNKVTSQLQSPIVEKDKLILLFKEHVFKFRDKRRTGRKDYLNGMAKVILKLYPELKESLVKATSETNLEEDLL